MWATGWRQAVTNKIFRSILSASIAVLLACLLLITGVLYDYFGDVQESELRDELALAAAGTQALGKDYLQQLHTGRYRLTWIGADGVVLYDTKVEAAELENHAGREEVQQALAEGAGRSIRYSATLTEKTLYEAVRLADGSVLRISRSRATAAVLVAGMLRSVVVIVLLAVALSVWLARRMAGRVVEPLNTLNLEQPMQNDVYEELSPLLRRMDAQQKELRLQMKSLRQKQEEFDQIAGNMREGLVLLDGKGRIVSINPAARALFHADGGCVGKDFLTLDRRQDIRLATSRAMEDGYDAFRAQEDGREYQFDLSRIESGGSVRGLVILIFDVTEQVSAERNRREFTANVSHELKTPLQSIIGSAELIESGLVKPQDMPRFIGHIHKEATRLVALIDDIIRLSQLDEGGELPREELSLRALAEEVSETLADAAGAQDVSLTVSGDAGMVNGVRRLLFELLYNLCDNAIKYNVRGGTVAVDIRDAADGTRLTVQDTGIGIPPAHQDKVFERFYRVDKSHSKQSGGTGLGLSIVKHAAQYHHAKLTLDSVPGKGTCITVMFPKQ